MATAVALTKGPILEAGCGDGSTPLLHYMARAMNRPLITADTNKDWLAKFFGYHAPERHELFWVQDWATFDVIDKNQWGLAFVDCAPGEMRTPLIKRLKGKADLIVAHDSERDYGSGADYKYEEIRPLFKFVSEWKRYRPYTLLLSDVAEFHIEGCDLVWDPKNL